MKRLIITLLFTLTSVAKLYACDYADDPQLQAAKASCSSSFGKEWSCSKNACVFTKHTVDQRNENDQQLDKCNEIENENEKKACFDEFARAKSGKLAKAKQASTAFTFGASVLAASLLMDGGLGSSCLSAKIALGASAVAIGGHFLLKGKLKKKLKKNQKKYAAKVNNKNSHDAQLDAFRFLKDQQDIIAGFAKKKKMLYTVQTAGFAAAMGMAAWELTRPDNCAASKKEGDTGTDTGADTGETQLNSQESIGVSFYKIIQKRINKITKLISTAIAFNPMDLLKGLFGAGDKAKEGLKRLKSNIKGNSFTPGDPKFTLVVGGVATIWSNKLRTDATKEEKDAKKKSEQIAALMRNFSQSLSGFCPGGREDFQEPRCFCFNKNGSRNENRTRSQTCQDVFAQDDINFSVGFTNFDADVDPKDREGCVRVDGKFDLNCKCRKLKNSKGENACLKVTPSVVGIGGIANQLAPAQVTSALDRINSGDSRFSNVNASALTNFATKNLKRTNDIIKKINKDNKSNLPNIDDKIADSVFNSFLTPKLKKSLTANREKENKLFNSTPRNIDLDKSLSSAQNALGKNNANLNAVLNFKSGSRSKSKSSKKSRNGFRFDDNGSETKAVVNLDNTLDKKYKYKKNDINNNPDKSIWNILTNRYNQTGLKKLFKDQ